MIFRTKHILRSSLRKNRLEKDPQQTAHWSIAITVIVAEAALMTQADFLQWTSVNIGTILKKVS
jgi:hypothetical protein